MAATYRLSLWRRGVNALVRALLGVGLGPRHTYLLTVRGRKTGRLYSTPVTLVEQRGRRWLVAPYGEVAWVRNARATNQVALSRGGQSKTAAIVEVRPEEAPKRAAPSGGGHMTLSWSHHYRFACLHVLRMVSMTLRFTRRRRPSRVISLRNVASFSRSSS